MGWNHWHFSQSNISQLQGCWFIPRLLPWAGRRPNCCPENTSNCCPCPAGYYLAGFKLLSFCELMSLGECEALPVKHFEWTYWLKSHINEVHLPLALSVIEFVIWAKHEPLLMCASVLGLDRYLPYCWISPLVHGTTDTGVWGLRGEGMAHCFSLIFSSTLALTDRFPTPSAFATSL